MQDILIKDGDLLGLLIDNIPDSVFVKDRNLCYVRTSAAHAQLMGIESPSEAVGKSDFDVFSPSDARKLYQSEKRVVETGIPVLSVEEKVCNRRGETFWLSGHILPVKNAAGEVVGLIGLIRNVTSVKNMEQELRNLNVRLSNTLAQLKQTQQRVIQHERLNALGEMASGVAHDFNNALMPILGYTDVLLSRPEILLKTEETLGMMKDIRLAAMDAAQAVRRLREFYRQAAEDEKFKGDLNKQIETAIILTRPRWQSEMGAKGIHIAILSDLHQIPMVNAKESQLREILINLILNAIDAMPEGGTITIRTRKDQSEVVLEVADTGVGMTDEVRYRCLEPFFTTKGEEGTGLGLSMAYGFVKRHNGSIDVISSPGKGATVVIRLPMESSEPAVPEPRLPLLVIPEMKILVLDDEHHSRRLLDMYLKADRHTVELASCGKEGLEMFSAKAYDLVITDRAMPDMSGDQVAAAIRAINKDIPVVMVTGFGDIMNENRQCPPGVDVVVSKPITHLDLRRAISIALCARKKKA